MIAKIVRITPDGNPFTTVNGTFHPFSVGFDNHQSGQANSKSNPPPWRVGELVGYTVTGQNPRGIDKLKITRSPDASFGNYVPPAAGEDMPGDPQPLSLPVAPRNDQRGGGTQPTYQQPRSVPQTAPEHLPVNLPHGATVGGAIARGVEIMLAQDPGIFRQPGWDKTLFGLAAKIVTVSRLLENGQGFPAHNQETDEPVPF